jgi:hypothetical protein
MANGEAPVVIRLLVSIFNVATPFIVRWCCPVSIVNQRPGYQCSLGSVAQAGGASAIYELDQPSLGEAQAFVDAKRRLSGLRHVEKGAVAAWEDPRGHEVGEGRGQAAPRASGRVQTAEISVNPSGWRRSPAMAGRTAPSKCPW